MNPPFITIEITDLGSKGEGIGNVEGLTVFVPNTLPGDVIDATLTLRKKNYAIGKLLQIQRPAETRVIPFCALSGMCGSCQIQELSYPAQLEFKKKKLKETLIRIGNLAEPPIMPILGMATTQGYRNKAIFPAQCVAGEKRLGFYQINSHDIVDVPHCPLQHDTANRLLATIRQFIATCDISLYDEKQHRGLLRHVLIRVAEHTGEALVCLIINGTSLPFQQNFIRLLQDHPELISICLNINTTPGNAILGPKTKTIFGVDVIEEHLGEIRYQISAPSFFQVNTSQADVLYQQIATYAELTGQETVLDLYCGAGSIALFLARSAHQLIGIEISTPAIHDARANATLNGITNTEFIDGRSELLLPELLKTRGIKPDIIIIDPPRKGCDPSLLSCIATARPKKLIYVSCDPATFSRDTAILQAHGLILREVTPVDLFPHTVHLECVALFD